MRSLLSNTLVNGAIVVALICAAPGVHASGPQAGPPLQVDAKKHFDVGVQAIRAKQWVTARQELLAAWQFERDYRIAAKLGRVEIELRQYRNAAEHLDYCLHHATEMNAEQKAAIQALFDEARAQVGTLDIRMAVRDATILVDDQVIGSTPLAAVFVEPGQRTITARKAGKTFQEKRVDIVAGQTAQIDIVEPPPEQPKALEPSPPTPKIEEQTPNWKYVAVPIGVGVTVMGFAVGIGYSVVWKQNVDERPVQTQQTQTGHVNQVQTGNATGAAIGYAVGGTALVATVIMAAWPSERAQRAGLFVAPVVGGGQGGVVVGGAF